MIKRPKNTDSEQDLLQMQMDYLKEKEKNANFQPAATVVKVEKNDRRQSEFAKRRGLKSAANNDPRPSTGHIVMGDIVERSDPMDVDVCAPTSSLDSFPPVEKINTNAVPTKGVSLFAHMRAEKSVVENRQPQNKTIEFGGQSVVVQGSEAEQIHRQNVDLLAGMSQEDVAQEREKILQSIDPSVLDFLKKMKAQKTQVQATPSPLPVKPTPTPPAAAVPELANTAQANKWVHFQDVEDEKLEWMRDVSVEVPMPKEGETYEARFDWKGTLLPFREGESSPGLGDTRELYLHGDEPHRPGYTLQELFRLARSDVLQQRVAALTSIQGILAIYNQGFYDQVLELPISKMFFLLRFSLDDKAMAVVEQALLGLANLFYNASDEFLLDCTFDTRLGREEPVFQDAKKRMQQMQHSFKKMSVASSAYKTPVQDKEEEMLNEDANLNDFHLAETDLVKCLLRTNIVERIQYLMNVMLPDKDSRIKESGVRILIRIARYGPDGVEKVTENFHLVDGLIDAVMDEGSPRTTRLILKLLRLIIGYSYVPDINVPVVMELAKKIVYNRDNLNTPAIRLQVEAMRLLRVILKDRRYQDSYNDFVPAIRYLFEWHYKFLDIVDARSAVVHQHVTAMIALLSHPLFCYDRNMCTEIMVLCVRKWLTLCTNWLNDAGASVELAFSQNVLLSVVFEFCAENKLLYQAVKDLSTKLITSPGFQHQLLPSLSTNTSCVKKATERSVLLPQLPNFGAVAFDRTNKVSLIIPQSSPVLLVNAILRLLTRLDRDLLKRLPSDPFKDVLLHFTTHSEFVAIMKRNWFCRHDLEFVFSIIQSGICKDIALVLQVTGLFVSCLKVRSQIEHLLQDIFFNPSMYQNKMGYEEGELYMWKDVYMQYYLMRQSTVEEPEESLLPVNWPYAILDIFYEQHVESRDKKKISFNIEKETEDRLIRVSMGMTTLLEANGVFLVPPTDRLIHLMMAFLSPECRFLEESVKECLQHRALFMRANLDSREMFQFKSDSFDFASFYTVLLNQFQSAGYADKLFSAVLMVPLATQYDVKWRKMVWSEHVAVLRFVSCATDEELVFSKYSDFVKPRLADVKDDEIYELSLLKSYNLAINMKQLKQDSLPFRIAQYYLANK